MQEVSITIGKVTSQMSDQITPPEIEQSVGDMLEIRSARYSKKIAIRFIHEGLDLSYKGLDDQVNRYANTFVDQGIAKGTHVGLMMPNTPDFVFSWLALAKIGAVAVPLNIGYQADDLKYILNNSEAFALVIDSEFHHSYSAISADLIHLSVVMLTGERRTLSELHLPSIAANSSGEFSTAALEAKDLLNIQYTSGTTGLAKGCMLTHEYWLIFAVSAMNEMEMTSDDTFLCVAPMYYLDAQWELLMTLCAGGTMVIAKKYSASNFMQWIRDYHVTTAFATMAAWTFKQPESPLDKQHKLRLMMVGQFPHQLHKPFEERFNVPLRAGYGMTESGPATTIPISDSHMTGSGSVGKLDRVRRARIVDDNGVDVVSGDIGELLLKGPGMMSGYYKMPDATAEVFKDGWLYTGDLFRVDSKGYYYIVGRKKEMIKRSGENISANEVENVLKSHPKIHNAAVIAVPDESRIEEVKAYVIPMDGETPSTIPPEELINFCQGKIADFKIPRFIEYRLEFDLTSVGKVIKGSLTEGADDLTIDCFDRLELAKH